MTYGPVCDPPPGSFFKIGETIVTCVVKDAAGNQNSIAFLVNVKSKIAGPELINTSVSVDGGKKKYQNANPIWLIK